MSLDCPTGPLPVTALTHHGASGRSRPRTAEFTAFVEDRYDHLLRLATLLTNDRLRGEELLQSSLVKTYEAFGRIQDTSRLEAYVRTVMVNSLRSSWRRKWREDSYADVPEPAATPDLSQRLVANDELKRMLAQLPARQRAAVILRFFDDLSEADTARVLGCSVGTVKSQTSRALAHLRRVLPGDPGGPPGRSTVRAV